MTARTMPLILVVLAGLSVPGPTHAQGDAQRGTQFYRNCAACHSLEPGVHLTGPSLAGVWGRRSATVDGFRRYSNALKGLDVRWDEDTLGAWVSNPQAMAPGTYMVFDGFEDDAQREDLIAFLAIVLREGGVEAAIGQGLLTREVAAGLVPRDLADARPEERVVSVGHCGDAFVVRTADGAETVYWERNVRLKIDSSPRGPRGEPVLVTSGMMGDRISIVFPDLDALGRIVEGQC